MAGESTELAGGVAGGAGREPKVCWTGKSHADVAEVVILTLGPDGGADGGDSEANGPRSKGCTTAAVKAPRDGGGAVGSGSFPE